VAGETSERGLRLLGVKTGDTIFVDGGAGGGGAVAVQMAVARGARVVASASEANQDYLREIRAIPVLYEEGATAAPMRPSAPESQSAWPPASWKAEVKPAPRTDRC
jgi:NADPH:quinone reductase-like Zn-dependent oxidoreductase